MERLIVIFAGYNRRAVIAFLRTLVRHKLNYFLVLETNDDPFISTDFLNNNFIVRGNPRLQIDIFLNIMDAIKNKTGVDTLWLAPSTESLNRFVLQHREVLSKHGLETPLVKESIYKSISDKFSFGALCISNGFLVPPTIDNVESSLLPFVAKPRKYYVKETSTGQQVCLSPIILRNEDQRRALLENGDVSNYYFQEYIKGQSVYLLYYFSTEGISYRYSQENLVQQGGGKSIVAATGSHFHLEPIAAKYEHFLKELGFSGLIMIELRVTSDGAYMIEANPRFWGPSQLFIDAGVNLFEVLLYDNSFILNFQHEPVSSDTMYFWFGGMLDSAQDINYFGISESDFFRNLPNWLTNDIYLRPDSEPLFKSELC